MSVLIVDGSPAHHNLIEGIRRKAGYSNTIALDSVDPMYKHLEQKGLHSEGALDRSDLDGLHDAGD